MRSNRTGFTLLVILSIADLCCIPLALLGLALAAMGTDGMDQVHPAIAAWLARLCLILAVLGPFAALIVQRIWRGYGWWATLPAIGICLLCWFNLLATG